MSSWDEISDIIDMSKPAAQEKIKVGTVLTFNQEGSIHSYKVMKLPKSGKVWVKRITTMTGDELNSHMGHEVDATNEAQLEHGGVWCETCQTVIGEYNGV